MYCVFTPFLIYIPSYISQFMSKNYSSKSDPWTYFSREADSIFNQDFIKDKLFTFKTAHGTPKGIVKFIQLLSREKGNELSFQEQLKIWIPTWDDGSSFYFNFKKNYAKVQYDNGLKQYQGKLINFYGGVRSQRNFQNVVFKFGANWLGVNTSLDSRLRIAMLNNENIQVSSGHKLNWSVQKWILDMCTIFNYHSPSIFSNSMRVIYKMSKDQSFFIKGSNEKVRKINNIDIKNLDTYFTNFSVGYTHNLDKLTSGAIQNQFTKNGLANTSVAFERKIQQYNSKIKGKISTNKSICLSYISNIKNYGKWILGLEVTDVGEKNNARLGLLIDLSL